MPATRHNDSSCHSNDDSSSIDEGSGDEGSGDESSGDSGAAGRRDRAAGRRDPSSCVTLLCAAPSFDAASRAEIDGALAAHFADDCASALLHLDAFAGAACLPDALDAAFARRAGDARASRARRGRAGYGIRRRAPRRRAALT